MNYTDSQKELFWQGTFAHEIGHAFGLDDNPRYSGTVPSIDKDTQASEPRRG